MTPYKYLSAKHLFIFGALLVTAISALEVSRGRAYNYEIFLRGTSELWQGLDCYSEAFRERNSFVLSPDKQMTEFLYLPAFALPFVVFLAMPVWLGAMVWNVFNYVSFFLILRYMPGLADRNRTQCFLFLLFIMAQNVFSFQYNFTVLNMFLLSFLLLEKERYWWAILLLTFSGVTKIYGFFLMPILLFYPQFWKNVARTAVCLAAWLLLPVVFGGWQHLTTLYEHWFGYIIGHADTRDFSSVRQLLRVYLGYDMAAYENIMLGAVGILTSLPILLWAKRLGATLEQRYQVFAILIALPVVWGGHTEKVTFLIPMAGYFLWCVSRGALTLTDKVLLWSSFFLFGIVPIDILCPSAVLHTLIFDNDANTGLMLNVILILLIWCRMVWKSYVEPAVRP
ncbi:MAG: DUF2029 domain-containing protein [Bacteroidaceae bacterium]|nr:DUF2029 domain-containing protein [Bacteroidaceae bacterium]